MSDEADRASEREVKTNEINLRLRKMSVPVYADECVECGLYIPVARQEATGGTELCIGCAENQEKYENIMK